MARGTTLEKLLDDYRAECRMSLNPAHNAQDRQAQVQHIQRVQQELWEGFNWPNLVVRRDVLCQNGQRYYDVPDDLDIDRLVTIQFRNAGRWIDLMNGISSGNYLTVDSDRDIRSWPIQRWHIFEGEQVEVWPIANLDGNATTLDGTIRFIGVRKLGPLVADSDTADIDDKLITLFCAAERLAASGAKDAQFKLDKANKRLAKLCGGMMPRKTFNMFSTAAASGAGRRPHFVTYRPPGT